MENLKQPKPDPKGKAITSFVFGTVSVVPLVVFILFILWDSLTGPHVGGLEGTGGFFVFIILPLFILTIVAGPIGLILGIMGLKSTKRNFAIAGIVLSIIALLPVICWASLVVIQYLRFLI